MSEDLDNADAVMNAEENENEDESMNGVYEINSRTDLTPYFIKSDHSVNKIHVSKVKTYFKSTVYLQSDDFLFSDFNG